MTMSSRWVDVAPRKWPWAPGARHIATRRCGSEPWSDSPASSTVVPGDRCASTEPALASATLRAALRWAGESFSGASDSRSPSMYGRMRSSTSTASTPQADQSASPSGEGA